MRLLQGNGRIKNKIKLRGSFSDDAADVTLQDTYQDAGGRQQGPGDRRARAATLEGSNT